MRRHGEKCVHLAGAEGTTVIGHKVRASMQKREKRQKLKGKSSLGEWKAEFSRVVWEKLVGLWNGDLLGRSPLMLGAKTCLS